MKTMVFLRSQSIHRGLCIFFLIIKVAYFVFQLHRHLLSVHTRSGAISVVIGGSSACGGGPTALPGPLEIITGVLHITTVSSVFKCTKSSGGST